jgi:hypothetical protein
MLNEKQTEILDRVPISVLQNLLFDQTNDSGQPGMTASTFVLWIMPEMRDAEPLDMFDYAVQRLRKVLEQRIADNARREQKP